MAPTPMCKAAILAGGLATRMGGRNKALIEVDGGAIVDRQLDALWQLFARGDVAAVIAAGDGPDAEEPYAARGLAVVRDRVSSQGPLAGLAAALAWADGARVLALACDMPHVDVRVLELILARTVATGADIALPVAGGKFQPLIACYSARCAALIERELAAGRRRASALPDVARDAGLIVHAIDEEEIRTVDPYLRSFANFNRASDLL